jgi:hypothetical protein
MLIQAKTNWQILGRLLMAPLMGLALVVALPFIGFGVLGQAGCSKMSALMHKYRQNVTGAIRI